MTHEFKYPNLDPITCKFVQELELNKEAKPLYELSPQDARKFLLDLQMQNNSEIDDIEVFDRFILSDMNADIDIRIVRPIGKNSEVLPLILYIHGGGWVMGDKETHDLLIKKLSKCTNSTVAFVNYSRSPEAAYPVALNECYSVLKYLYNNHSAFNIDPYKIIVAGDSAGGNIAAVLSLKSKLEDGPKILHQLLLYPVIDSNMDTNSYKDFKNGPYLTKKSMEYFWDAYVPDKKLRKDKYVSPIYAELSDLNGIAPATIIVAENDVLRDEGEQYARKLQQAEVDTFCIRINGTCHDFLMLNALSKSVPSIGTFGIISHILNKSLYH